MEVRSCFVFCYPVMLFSSVSPQAPQPSTSAEDSTDQKDGGGGFQHLYRLRRTGGSREGGQGCQNGKNITDISGVICSSRAISTGRNRAPVERAHTQEGFGHQSHSWTTAE